jgi:translation initiation factor 1
VTDDLGSISGLPDELGIDDDLGRATQRVTIGVDRRRYGKAVTVVGGLDGRDVDVDELASTLKSRLAVGGTVDDGRIELQGDHTARLPDVLREQGFTLDA